jgi:hypothetical protein
MGHDVIWQHGRDFDAQLLQSLLCFARHAMQSRWDALDGNQSLTTSFIKKVFGSYFFWVLIFS